MGTQRCSCRWKQQRKGNPCSPPAGGREEESYTWNVPDSMGAKGSRFHSLLEVTLGVITTVRLKEIRPGHKGESHGIPLTCQQPLTLLQTVPSQEIPLLRPLQWCWLSHHLLRANSPQFHTCCHFLGRLRPRLSTLPLSLSISLCLWLSLIFRSS